MDTLDKSDREKEIDAIVNSFSSKKKWKNEIDSKISKWFDDYEKELEDYEFIYNIKEFNKIKIGGYIRYFNLNEEFRWGGILLKKKYDKEKDRHLMVIGNTEFKRFVLSFEKNYIFYKNHKTANDKLRKIFLSYLNDNDVN